MEGQKHNKLKLSAEVNRLAANLAGALAQRLVAADPRLESSLKRKSSPQGEIRLNLSLDVEVEPGATADLRAAVEIVKRELSTPAGLQSLVSEVL